MTTKLRTPATADVADKLLAELDASRAVLLERAAEVSDLIAAIDDLRRHLVQGPATESTWQHGALVRARFNGKIFDARVVRETADGGLLVHWAVDDTFSEIDVADVVGTSERPWKRARVPRDFEIEL